MTWNRNLVNLRNVLAGLYWTPDDARRVALDTGLNPALLRFSSRPVNTWTFVLEEAQNQNKLAQLISRARGEYPELQVLQLAEQNLLLDVESSEIRVDEWNGPSAGSDLEKIVGGASTLRPIHFLQAGLEVSRSVGRIVLSDGSRGTGFLIKHNLLLTNHHVLSNETEARTARLEFNAQKTIDNRDAAQEEFTFAPEDGFFTSPAEEDNGDDLTAVRVRGDANARWGAVPLNRAEPKLRDEVIIIQHPGGGDKQIALSHNFVVFVDERRIQYLTDTLAGSSGSPVFNTEWRLVGIHHKGGWLREPGSKSTYYRNQGVHISVVVKHLEEAGLL